MEGWTNVEYYSQFLTFGNACLVGVIISLALRDAKSFSYFAVLSVFIFAFAEIWPFIKSFDENKIYRYLITSFSQSMFAFTVYALFIKGKVRFHTCLTAAFGSFVIIFFQMYRLFDRHFADLPYAHRLITDGVQLANCALVLAGFGSVIYTLIKKGTNNARNSIDNRDDIFRARSIHID